MIQKALAQVTRYEAGVPRSGVKGTRLKGTTGPRTVVVQEPVATGGRQAAEIRQSATLPVRL